MKLPLQPAWLPNVPVEAIVCHWNAGGPTCGPLELADYHFIIDQELVVHRGNHSIADNARPLTAGSYAAHCLHFNQHNGRAVVGVSICGMGGPNVTRGNAGPFPITAAQVDLQALCVAQICVAYNIAVTPQTVLQHGEVQANRGIAQRGKWDVCWWPFSPKMTSEEVGAAFRAKVQAYVNQIKNPVLPPRLLFYVNDAAVPVVVQGARLTAGAWFTSGAALNTVLGTTLNPTSVASVREHLKQTAFVIDDARTATGNHLNDPTNPRQYIFVRKSK